MFYHFYEKPSQLTQKPWLSSYIERVIFGKWSGSDKKTRWRYFWTVNLPQWTSLCVCVGFSLLSLYLTRWRYFRNCKLTEVHQCLCWCRVFLIIALFNKVKVFLNCKLTGVYQCLCLYRSFLTTGSVCLCFTSIIERCVHNQHWL